MRLKVADGVWIGENVTIQPGCRVIGENARILDGAVVYEDVRPGAIMAGDPARQVGTVD